MGQEAETNALRRKASAGQREKEAEGLSPARAFRLAMARAAGSLWELPLTVTGVRHELIGFEDLNTRLKDDMMSVLLDGPEGGRGGLSVDRTLLTAVTEIQTIGQVTERDPSDRPFTSTDAALFSPLLDAVMERLDMMLNKSGDAKASHWILGYRFGAMMDNVRTLCLAIEGIDFHILDFEVDIATGLKHGRMILVLPDTVPLADDDEDSGPPGPGAHADSLSQVSADLSAFLPSVQLPLSAVSAFKPGEELVLEPNALNSVLLKGNDGATIARGKLGKVDGHRALLLAGRSARGNVAMLASGGAAGESAFEGMNAVAGLPAEGGAMDMPMPDMDIPDMGSNDGTEQEFAVPDLPPLPFDTNEEDDLPDLPPLDFGGDGAGGDLPELPDLPPLPEFDNASFE